MMSDLALSHSKVRALGIVAVGKLLIVNTQILDIFASAQPTFFIPSPVNIQADKMYLQ